MQNKPVQKGVRHLRACSSRCACSGMQQTNASLFPGISGSTLKLIAILSMLIDHAGATIIRTLWQSPVISSSVSQSRLWSEIYKISRSVGRIAFPIFCFLIVEGFLHTRNVWRYARRLFLFSLISEIPFDLALKGSWYFPEKQNVYFTLLIGLLVLIGLRFSWNHRTAFCTGCGRSYSSPGCTPPSGSTPITITRVCS